MRALSITLKPPKKNAEFLTIENVNRVMGIKEWGLVIVLSIIWGGSFFFTGVAIKEVTPLTIAFSRVGFASIILLAIVYLKGEKMPSSLKLWGAFFIMGILNNSIPFSLISWGQAHIESSLASILNATTPIFSVILAHFLTRKERLGEQPGLNTFVGMGMIFIGLIAIDGRLIIRFRPKEIRFCETC